jgi:hypothetical protein
MERRLLLQRRVTWNGARLMTGCALDHNHECCESQTVPNLMAKIELNGALYSKKACWYYPRPAEKNSVPMLNISQI